MSQLSPRSTRAELFKKTTTPKVQNVPQLPPGEQPFVDVFFNLFNVRLPIMTMTTKQLNNSTLFLDQYKTEYVLMRPRNYDVICGAFIYAPDYIMILTSDFIFLDICLSDADEAIRRDLKLVPT